MIDKKEIRILGNESLIRKVNNDDKENRKIEGYALVFNQRSKNLGGFTEVIDPNSLDEMLTKQDVLALLNHDESRGLLARYTQGKGSLELQIDGRGLKYSFDAPKTPLGDELIEGVTRGDINASSFGFSVEEENIEWRRLEDQLPERRINKFTKIYDVSPAYRAAYSDTNVKIALRSLENIKSKELMEYYKDWEQKIEDK